VILEDDCDRLQSGDVAQKPPPSGSSWLSDREGSTFWLGYDICRIDIYEKSRRLGDVKRLPRKPTNAEVAILRVLWSRGPSTVREVARVMGREATYTTILKLMQNMTDKELVRRDESSRTHVYTAARPEEQTQRQLVTDLLERVFDGSATKLVMQALAAANTSPKEVAEIRKLLEKHRGGRR
jgi:predicted transcriptional regulator